MHYAQPHSADGGTDTLQGLSTTRVLNAWYSDTLDLNLCTASPHYDIDFYYTYSISWASGSQEKKYPSGTAQLPDTSYLESLIFTSNS